MKTIVPPPEQATGVIEQRKRQHLDICLNEDVEGAVESAGFDLYRFKHRALPELDFGAIDTSCRFLNKRMNAPLMVSSMTGGTEQAERINAALAEAAQRRGWAMGLGSLRAAIENPSSAPSYQVRRHAPDVPLLANLGAAQLNRGYGIDECRRAMDLTGADALVLHLNGLQELFQPEGDVDFGGLLRKIGRLCKEADFPVGVKEVGWGIDGDCARALAKAGVAFLDVAGAGGTSWSQVESFRSEEPIRKEAARAFAGWGNPTAECIVEASAAAPGVPLIGSGGVKSGVDAAKAIALGADLAAIGRSLLAPSLDSPERLERFMERVEYELRAAMFGIGAANLKALRETDRLVRARW